MTDSALCERVIVEASTKLAMRDALCVCGRCLFLDSNQYSGGEIENYLIRLILGLILERSEAFDRQIRY